VAVEKEFYIIRDSSGNKSNLVEDWLANSESEAIPIIRELNAKTRQLTEQERHILAKFIALLRLRTTVFNAEMEEVIEHYATSVANDAFKDERSARELFASLAVNNAPIPADRIESFVSQWKAGRCTLKVNREYIIHLMIQRADSFANELFAMTWSILRTLDQNASFVTAEMPWSMLTIDPTKSTDFAFRDMFLPHVRTVVPLTKKVAVMLEVANPAPSTVRFGRVPSDFTDIVNRTITDNSNRFVFSCNESLLHSLVKFTKIDQVDRPVRLYGGREDWVKPDASQIISVSFRGPSIATDTAS
jgi:hypothetical protein